jgi:hypothetical protein
MTILNTALLLLLLLLQLNMLLRCRLLWTLMAVSATSASLQERLQWW